MVCVLVDLAAVRGCHTLNVLFVSPEQGGKLLGLLLTGSTGQYMAGRNGLA
jgi:hypothetical protein